MKTKKTLAVLLAIITLVTTIVSTLPITAMAAESKSDTATLKVGKTIYYSTMWTNDFTIKGVTAYCANPAKGTPAAGTYKKVYDFESRMTSVATYGKAEYYRACVDAVLWYGYGGPGFDKSMWPSKNYEGKAMTDADYQALTHVMLAFYYEGNANRALKGTTTDYQNWVLKNIMGRKDGSWAYEDAPMYQIVHNRTKVPDDFVTYVLATSAAKQDIASYDYDTGSVKVAKVSANPEITNNNSNYSLEGAIFKVYNATTNKVVATLTTDAKGNTDEAELVAGSYYIKESRASDGFLKNTEKFSFTLKKGDSKTITIEEPIEEITQGIKKVSAKSSLTKGNSAYSLEGAVYAIYDVETNTKVDTITSGANGNFSEVSLAVGDYYAVEEIAPKGFKLNTEPVYFTVTAGENTTVKFKDEPIYEKVGVLIQKVDGVTGKNEAQGGGSLAGAEFTVNYYADSYDSVSALKDVTPDATWVLSTDEDGKVFMDDDHFVIGDDFFYYGNQVVLPPGTITIEETDAPEGYLPDTTVHLRKITGDSNSTDTVSFTAERVSDDPIYGGVKVTKYDIELDEATSQGDASLSGARFAITNTSANPVTVNGVEYPNGEVVEIIETNTLGVAETARDLLPYGTYHITEITSPTGYLNTGIIDQDFMITRDGEIVELTGDDAIKNNPIRGGVKLQKRDFETKESTPQGSATLEGAIFEITNVSKYPVLVEGTLYQPGEVVKTVTTGADGSWTSTDDLLPYGTYKVTEVQSSTGYLLEGILERTFEIRENKVIVDMTGVDNAIQNQVKRGDLEFVKIEDGTNYRMANIPFRITSKTTGESHVIVTDDNGYASTSSAWNLHSQNTNRGQTSEDGIWFGLESVLREDKGALIYDTYIIDELPCDNNKDKELLTGIEVRIYRDNTVVDMGTLTDDLITISTTATDKKTGSHGSNPVENTTIVDTVKYENLNIGDTYTIKGTLMNKATGAPVVINGQQVTATKTWTADRTDGSIELEFTFDARTLGQSTVVVFEQLYCNNVIVASHEDIDDKDQTIVFNDSVKIGTTATDTLTGDHSAFIRTETTIKDVVSYDGLVPWREYIVKGTLMDKATGNVLIANNQPVTAEAVFTARTASGTVELEFTFDSSALTDGQSLVVFEELYWQDQLLGEHKDINDEGQTVTFRKAAVGTTAADWLTGNHTGYAISNTTVVDTVLYSGLITGKTYTVKGTLMSKATGKPVLIDGKEITAETTIYPEAASGIVTLDFTFDATKLEDADVVVFEELYYNGEKIASHEDINDEGQTVSYKTVSIGTTAVDYDSNSRDAVVSDTTTIVDTVAYTNLDVGETYTVKGVVMDKTTGKPVLIDGKEVTAETEFMVSDTDGSVDVLFTFDSTDLAGKDVVIFETLYYKDEEITSHKDIEDEGQTVHFSKIELRTTATDKETGEHEMAASDSMQIVDVVEYDGLCVGREYTLRGTLMDKSTGKPLLIDGETVTAEMTFTPTETSGSVEMIFAFDGSDLDDVDIVVFEELYFGEKKIASHEDIDDAGQTVSIYNPGLVIVGYSSSTPDSAIVPASSSASGTSYSGSIKTGDTGMVYLIPGVIGCGVALAAGAVIIVLLYKKRAKAEKNS